MDGVVLAGVIAVSALLIGVAGLVLAVTITRRIGTRDPIAIPPFWRKALRIKELPEALQGDFAPTKRGTERIAFIANPTKPGMSELRERALRAASIRYLPQPMWLYTTEDDPGGEAAQEALEAGADVVVAVGGDGTVRAIAAELAGTGVPLAILPTGTGNLFARNLELPLGDTAKLLRIALDGDNAAIDVGWLDLDRGPRAQDERHVFLVIAGAGLDAEMVAGADERLKRRLGWIAYFFAALKHLSSRRMTASVSVDGSDKVTTQMRTVLFANVGKLPGGLMLVPDASAEDGWMDVATLDARAGIVGWTELFGSVVAQGAGLRVPDVLKAYGTSRIDHARGKSIVVTMDHMYKVQADGEGLGLARGVTATVDHGALMVRRASK
ncbi:diacylglycerol kinase family protein [Demequina sp.]|uniref:diacylglycerol/lipid kinase family protein n=1 Tax=Demequina sp. TaxID=2050685 RepID=UPI0025BBEC5D|nr:diacylglycerol kinase family protein [Demequina sp.]